jgi:hypothetical protein
VKLQASFEILPTFAGQAFLKTLMTSALQKKINIVVQYLVAPILFVWLCYSIYHQINAQEQLPSFIASLQQIPFVNAFGYLIVIIILTACNWGLEAYKWKALTYHLEPLSFKAAFAAILTGQAVSFSSINRVGESIGKSMLLSDGNRLKGVVLSFVASASQLLITLLAGLIAFVCMYPTLYPQLQTQLHLSDMAFYVLGSALLLIVVLLMIIYFAIPFFANKLSKASFFSRYIFLLTSVQAIPKRLLVKLILISGARYLVFLLQYLLIFTLCSVDISALHIVSLTALLFLILAIIPTLTLAELGIRGKVSLFLFGIYSTNTIGILAVAGGIWLLNLIIPACLGGLILLRLQYFRKQV